MVSTVSIINNHSMNTNLSLHKKHVSANLDTGLADIHFVLPQPVMFVDMASPLDHRLNKFVKRLYDIVISSAGILLLLSWMTPVMAILIILDSKGPVFFLQKRLKKGGKYFNCIKFRTMMINPEADTLAAYENDHRITRVGRFLRRHHLDELPQLWNVLVGDMSIIGPRPYMITDSLKYERAVDKYKLRYKVKPGITGLAQSFGHFGSVAGEEKMNERVNYDLNYIMNWSLKMDLHIICRTLWMIVKR
jgi:putative colanic acid biosysnthesis UDP-glucose lipid carrier transferase